MALGNVAAAKSGFRRCPALMPSDPLAYNNLAIAAK
jgi:hypothetical protein